MSFEDLKKIMDEKTKSQIVELPSVKQDEKEKLAEIVKKQLFEEIKKSLIERRFYEDTKGGVITAVRFPKKSDKERKICSDPKVSKNKSIQWWGPKLPLMDGTICTCFFPEDWEEDIITKGMLWEAENPTDKNGNVTKTISTYYLMRGTMKREDRWIEDKAYHRSEEKMIAEARKRYENREINDIYDIPYEDLDRPKYTFSITQLIGLVT